MARLPRSYESFRNAYPEIAKTYDQLGALSHGVGPLPKKDRELVKLAMAIGARLEGAVHSHARRALEEGAKPEEIYHVVLLSLTTLGFPSTVTAMTWVKDVLKENKGRRVRRKKQ